MSGRRPLVEGCRRALKERDTDRGRKMGDR